MTYLVNGRSNDLDRQRIVGSMYKEGNEKSRQHSDFPGGHPPEYYPSLRLLNFAERTGYGVLSLRWPSTLLSPSHSLLCLTTLNNPKPKKRPFFPFRKQNLSGMPTCTLQCMSRHPGWFSAPKSRNGRFWKTGEGVPRRYSTRGTRSCSRTGRGGSASSSKLRFWRPQT